MAQEPAWLSQSSKVDSDSWLDQVSKPLEPSQAKKDLPLIDITDIASSLGETATSLPTTVTASLGQMYEGTMNPWEKGPESLQRQKEMRDVQREAEKAQAEAEASGEASVFSRAIRSGIPSYGFTGAIIPPSFFAGGVTALATGAATRNPVAAQRAAMAAGTAASGYAAYRMAASQFLDDARERIDSFFLEKVGRLPNKQEQDEAYQELRPLAQEMGMAEALPEAFGNLALAGAGKYIYRILGGKTGVQQLASGALSKVKGMNVLKAVGAGAAGAGTEVGTETVTEVFQESPYKKLEEGIMKGQPVEAVEIPPFTLERFKQGVERVAEPTLATTAMMGLVGGAGGIAYRGLTRQNFEESEFRDKMTKQAESAEKQLSSPDITPSQRKFLADKVEESNAALKALDEGRSRDVEKYFNVRFTKPELPSMPSPEEVAVQLNTDAAKSLEAAGSSESAKAQAGFDATLKEILPKTTEPTIPTVKEAEKVEPEVTAPAPAQRAATRQKTVQDLTDAELEERISTSQRLANETAVEGSPDAAFFTQAAETYRAEKARRAAAPMPAEEALPPTPALASEAASVKAAEKAPTPTEMLLPKPLERSQRQELFQRVEDKLREEEFSESKLEKLNKLTKTHQEYRRDLQDAIDRNASRGELRSIELDLMEIENRVRALIGEEQVPTSLPITQEDQTKAFDFFQNRALEIEEKIKAGEPLTENDRKDWASAGRDEALLPAPLATPPSPQTGQAAAAPTPAAEAPPQTPTANESQATPQTDATRFPPSPEGVGYPQARDGSRAVITTPSSEIIGELAKLPSVEAKLNWLRENRLLTQIEGSNSVEHGDRVMVLMRIGNTNIPFYISTGMAGKKNVAAGKWYAVWGIGSSGWINKGREEDINAQYGFPVLQKLAKILNEGVGFIDPNSVPALADFDSVNSQMNMGFTPAADPDDQTFWSNVKQALTRINEETEKLWRSPAPAPAQDPLTLAKSQPVGTKFTDYRGDVWEKVPDGWTLTSKEFEGFRGIETTRPMTDEIATMSIRDQLLSAPAPPAPLATPPSPQTGQAAAPAVEEPTLTPEPKLYAPAQVPSEESVYEEPQDRTEGRKAEETGVGDRLLRPAEGEVEEEVMPSPEVAADPFAAAPLVDNLPALIAVRDNNATPEQVQSLVDQGLVEQVEGQNIITEAGVAAMPEDQRPKLTPAERAAEVEGMAVPVERDVSKLEQMSQMFNFEDVVRAFGYMWDEEGGGINNSQRKHNWELQETWSKALQNRWDTKKDISESDLEKLRSFGWANKAISEVRHPLNKPFRSLTKNISATDFNAKLTKLGVPKKERDEILRTTPGREFSYNVPAGRGTGRAMSYRTGFVYEKDAANQELQKAWSKKSPLATNVKLTPTGPSQTTKVASEKPSPAPLREGAGVPGVVQAEPVEESIPTVGQVSPETETSSRENLGPKVAAAEQKQVADDQVKKKRQKKQDESTNNSRNSVFDPQKKNAVIGTVTKADVETAREALTNSGEIPNAYLTNVYESLEAFLADKANERLFPSSYARLQTEKDIEGLYENGQTLIFAKQIEVSDLDRNLAKMLGITPEQAAARRVIAHENGHRAISLFTMTEKRELRRYLMRAYSDEQIAKLVEKYTEYADWRTNPESRLEALEELLMRDFERMEKIPTGGVWDDIVQFLKRVWRRLTGQKGEPTLKELKDVARLMRNALKRPAVPLGSFTLKNGGNVKLSFAGDKAIENLPTPTPVIDIRELNAEYLAAVESGDTGNDNLNQLLRDASPDERKAVVDSWIKRNPKAAARMQKMVDEAVSGNKIKGDYIGDDYEGVARTLLQHGNVTVYGGPRLVVKSKNLDATIDIENEVLILDEIEAREGAGSRMLADMFAAAQETGIEAVKLTASKTLGGWFWANRGFDPETLPTKEIKRRVDLLPIDQDIKNEVIDLLENADLLSISELDEEILPSDYALLETKDEIMSVLGNRPSPLGKVLLVGTRWDAIKDIDGAIEIFPNGKIKSADPVTFDDAGNVIPLSQRFQPTSPDIRFSRVTYSSPTDAANAAGSEAARSTIYNERDIDVREAIRSAYEAMPKDTGIAVPIGDLFAKTEELMPDVTQDEFSNVLQDLFEDNGAVLQEGEQIIPEQEVEIQAFEKDNPFNEIIRKSPEKSPSLGEINGVSKKFVQRVLRPASSFATNNGIRIDDNAPLQARAMPDGSIIIGYSLSQERFDELQKMAPQAASQYTKDSIIEELIHLSDLIGLRNQWIKSDKKISFDQFVLGQQSNLAFSLIQKADSLNDLEAESLRRILASSLSLYSNNPAIVNLGLNELLDLASQYPYILPELVRSLIQLKKTGQLTETAFRKIANVLREWQEIVLQWISEGYVSAKEGVFGEMLSERIKNAENNLVQLSGTSEINVTTPEGRRAGFVVVMPRPSKASRIPIENAEEASKSFKVDLAEAGKGRVETKAKFKGKPLKDTEIPEHNVKSYDLYRDAAIKLIDDLMAETNDILVVAEALQDPEFQIAVGLQVSKDVSSDMITIARSQIGLEIENRLANEIKKERNPRRKRELELAEKRGIIYYNAGTGAGQALQNRQEAIADPRYRSRILFTEAKLHKENKAKEKLDAITGGTEKITDIITGAEEKAAEETTQAEVEAQESAVEDDQDAIDLAAGEATLKDPERSLYEEYKDLLREEGILARLDELDNIKAGSKASISTERRNELANLTREERTKLREKNKQRRMEILAKLLGKEEEAKTPEQKVTRTKRKKMVDTAKKRVEAGKDIETSKEGETESSEEQVSKAERTAQAILKDLSERYADPIIFPDRESKINEMRELYKERVKQGVGPNQMTEKSFVNKAVELGADEKTAGILWKAAELEIDAREAMRQDKILQRKAAVGARADAQAHRIIFAKERLKRQSGFAGIDTNPNKDTIIQAFRDQVKNPASLEDFVARLKSLNVSETVAKRLFTAAEREKADLEAMEAFKALEGPDALKRMLNEMNKARPADSVPLERAMPWRKILSSNPKDVAEYRQRIFEAISDLPSFQNLTDEQKERLADLYAEAWENRRQAILDRMLRDEIKKARDRDEISEDVEKKLQQSRNKILEIINLGGFNNDDLVKILGERYGISTSFTEEQKARIQKLADQLQDEDMNTAKRNKLAMEFAVELAGAMDVPVSEIISNWWTSSVLFGPQTIFSIGAAFLNGGYSIATIGTSRMLTKLIQGDIQGAIEESILMLKGFARYLGAFKQSGNRAWNYLWTGDVGLLGAGSTDILNEINNFDKLQKFQRHKLLAEQLAKDPRMVRRYVGVYLRFVSRLLTALDAFNVMVTKAGTASLALRMSGMSTDKIIEAEKMLKLKAYKEQVIRDYFDNKAPQTPYEKALVDSYAEAEMYRAVNELGGKMENADYLASESAMTMQPTGFGGVVYDAITSFFAQRQSNADEYLEKMKKDWINNKDLKAVTFLALAYLRQFAAYNAAGLTGSKFVRYASNKFNQGISFIPFAGLLRQLEAKDDKIKGKDAFRETIYRNQVVSFVMLLVGAAVIRAIQDEPDDEERGNFWNGGWANLTPDQKKQMLAKGQKEYTMGFKYNGRWYVFNYQNWPLNQVLSAIGSMSDQIRFSPEKWDEKNALSKSVAGMVAGVKSTLEIPALSGLQDLIGNRLASKDPTEQTLDRLSRVTSGWVGGFVPRILKDIDFYTQPELRKYETLWEKTASHIPIYRRYVGEEYYDILGQQIKRNVIPGSREFMVGPTEPEYKILGALNARNIFLTPANAEYRMIGKGRNRRRLTQEEADAYSLETGRGYRDMLLRYGQRALQMPTERARAFLKDKADEVRDRALKRAYRR